jgi:hypothetical protein
MKTFLVSIIVPCYNQSQFLDEALQSVFDQTYTNWECIIVNDDSPDNTEEVAKKWVEKDSRFVYLYMENGGVSAARNLGLDIATGDYVQFLDADDCLHHLKFEKSLELVKKHNADLIISNYVVFNGDKDKIIPTRFKLQEDYFNFQSVVFKWEFEYTIPIHCALFNVKYFEDFRFSIDLKVNEDWIMWITVFRRNPSTQFINKPFALYRDHVDSVTKDKHEMQSNHIKALLHLKNILAEEDYNKLMTLVLTNLYANLEIAKTKLTKIKKSKTYKWGCRLRNLVIKLKY